MKFPNAAAIGFRHAHRNDDDDDDDRVTVSSNAGSTRQLITAADGCGRTKREGELPLAGEEVPRNRKNVHTHTRTTCLRKMPLL